MEGVKGDRGVATEEGVVRPTYEDLSVLGTDRVRGNVGAPDYGPDPVTP